METSNTKQQTALIRIFGSLCHGRIWRRIEESSVQRLEKYIISLK